MEDRRGKKLLKRFFIAAVALQFVAAFFFASLFLFHDVFNFTTSNSAIYIVKDRSGGFSFLREMPTGHSRGILFSVNANRIFDAFMKNFAKAAGRPLLELTWDEEDGSGIIKQFRADGKILSATFSRFMDMGEPHGLFMGGDMPYGDLDRDPGAGTSGMGFFNGGKWHHIWCASNEGLKLSGAEKIIGPVMWKFLGSKKIKDTYDEVVVESYHEAETEGKIIRMKRKASFRAGDDYLILSIKFTNPGDEEIEYLYAYGDEPWVGEYGDSGGDVGWHKEGMVETETAIDPLLNKHAGFWDYGNVSAGEARGYSGYADFIEWLTPTPSYVFLSNGWQCCIVGKPIESSNERVINIVWTGMKLKPGETIAHRLAIGMAKSDSLTFPVAPAIDDSGH